MARDLERIEQLETPTSDDAMTVVRYLSAIDDHRRVSKKKIEEERRRLSRLSTAELKKLAGVKE